MMNSNQMADAAKKDAQTGKYWGLCVVGNIQAKFSPVLQGGTVSKDKGRINWTIDGKRATLQQVQSIIG